MEQAQTIDTKKFHDYVGNERDEIEFMIDLFIQQSGIYCTELEMAYTHDDCNEWHDITHKFKGMAGFTGATTLHQTCLHAQENHELPKDQKILLLHKIQKDVQDAIAFLENYRGED